MPHFLKIKIVIRFWINLTYVITFSPAVQVPEAKIKKDFTFRLILVCLIVVPIGFIMLILSGIWSLADSGID